MTGKDGLTFTINPLGLFSQASAPEEPEVEPEKKSEQKPKAKKPEQKGVAYNNEFTEIYHEFINDVAFFRDKYPLTSLITIVFFAFLGISSFFSLSITGVISCVLFCATSYCLAKSISSKGTVFWTDVKNSLFEIFQASSRKPTISMKG